MIIKKQYAYTLVISTFILGLFQIVNDDYLVQRGVLTLPESFQWIDDNITGAIIIVFSLVLAYSFWRIKTKLQKICIVLLGALYFSLGTIYLVRSVSGYHNITWILLFTLFFLLIFSIRYKWDIWLYERNAQECSFY